MSVLVLLAGCGSVAAGAATRAPAPDSDVSGATPSRHAPSTALAPTGPEAVVIHAVDVGQGDAIYVDFGFRRETPSGLCSVDWLIDAGPSIDRLGVLTGSLQCEIDAFVLTHPHADHYRAAEPLCAHRYDGRPIVLRVFGNGERRGPPRDREELSSWRGFQQALEDAGLELEPLAEAEVLNPVPGVTVTVLWAGDAEGGHFEDTSHGSDINNDSLVLMLEFAGRRVLLAGDTETEAHELILDRYCTPDEYHHPRAGVVQLLLELGAEVRSTSAEGEMDAAVEIRRDGSLVVDGPDEVFAWREGPSGWEEVILPVRAAP